jgi:hypothetical protein
MTTPEGPGNQGPANPYLTESSVPGGYPPPPPPPAPGGYPPPGPGAYPPQQPGYGAPQPGYAPPPGPAGWGQQPAPPAKNNGLRTGIIAVVVLVVLVGGIVLALNFFRDSISGDVTELRVGDCIDEPVGRSTVSDVQHQPCTSAHDAEVVYVLTDASATYPGVEHFRTVANDQCATQATAYLGAEFDSRSDISGGFFYPTEDSWGSGDHDVTCYVNRADGGKLYASIKGIGTAPLPGTPAQ